MKIILGSVAIASKWFANIFTSLGLVQPVFEELRLVVEEWNTRMLSLIH